ncbi:MAG: 2,3-bisphosphoglycerate-independent phosphoglycerate mutase [Armatimonadota bacterium]|nr:2,3-bisphosphoglycerate-independent phosphoglycerate mutase [Armatimonadota bacterium]MDR7404166.1 2,3-bisphosphoglycerate-independent phosphoglycerate mutase [Armatimonadota bacterium]
MKRLLYVVLDGLADRPVADLQGRTPLEAAPTPHLDDLAARGQQGIVTTVGEGIAPESDVAVMAILGYDPLRYHTGRGPLEALGAGLAFRDGDVALRGNFATVDAGWTILDRRVGRSLQTEEAAALAEAVSREVRLTAAPAEVEVAATVAYRCAVVLRPREGRLSAKISNTDPAYGRVEGLGVARAVAGTTVEECRPLDDSPEAWTTAELVNEFTRKSREVLDAHPVNERRRRRGQPPANAILLRDAGDHLPAVPSLAERFGLSLGCFVEMPVERGIARLLGMAVVEVPPSAGDRERAYRQWARRAAEELPRHGGLYLHLKGPDEPGHDGDCAAKRDVIALIDRAFFGDLLPRLNRDETVVAVTADHATPCSLRAHSDDPVPLLVSGGGVSADGTRAFSEREAARGALGARRGVEILPLLARLVGP